MASERLLNDGYQQEMGPCVSCLTTLGLGKGEALFLHFSLIGPIQVSSHPGTNDYYQGNVMSCRLKPEQQNQSLARGVGLPGLC